MIKTLQNYRILSQIGEGGMGIVYLGEHISLKRKVAIKALHPNFSGNNTIRQRFINEGITLSNLNHPNIVILYDFIEQSDGLYLVMEYVEGNTLDNLLETRKEPVKEEEFIPIFKKILNAFQYAHSRGIIHRDIKPSNILLNQYLEPKILDFGIAKIVESNVKITSTGMRLGSILYMSPEQVLGKEIDIRTDIYSLGITLFEVLTGRTPYDVTTNSEYEIQTKIVMEDLKPAKLFNPLLSERINLIIHKATAKEPTARFQNCEEFMRALDGEEITLQRGDIQKTQIQGVPVGISRPGVPPVGIPVKKGINPAIIIISVVSFMVIVTLAVLIFLKAKDKKESSSKKNDTTINYFLGNSVVRRKIFNGSPRKYLIINVNENEVTSISAALGILKEYGGKFIYLNHTGSRNIRFNLNGKFFEFDPNRIFTLAGIKKTLNNLGNYSSEAEQVVNEFAKFIIKEITKDSLYVIAVHNNSDDSYSADSYNGSYKQDAKKININKSEDPDDFFFVVRESDFEYLKLKGYNVILQDNENVRDDGSLSVYCGKNNIPYINVETQEGKYKKQFQMIEEVINCLNSNK